MAMVLKYFASLSLCLCGEYFLVLLLSLVAARWGEWLLGATNRLLFWACPGIL